MLKQLLEKKSRKRHGDHYTYYGMPTNPYWPTNEYRAGYPGEYQPQIQTQGNWGMDAVYSQQMIPYEGFPAYQPYYDNQLYQQPTLNPYYMEQFSGGMPVPYMQDQQTYSGYQGQEITNQYQKQQVNPFQNPLYSKDEDYLAQQANTPITHPYPKQSFMQKNQGSNFSSVLNQFKTQEGSIDFNKMIDTAGMMLNSMNQVSNLVKGVGSIFKVTT